MKENTYSIQELREILFDKINRLMEIEPYWHKCSKCPNQGKCCIDADILIREDEWNIIKNHISTLNREDKLSLKYNIENKCFCPFRTIDKCLIHEVRPLNCVWTPFQVVQNIQNGNITYYKFEEKYKDYKFSQIVIENFPKITEEYVLLKTQTGNKYYLFLNDVYIPYITNSDFKIKNLSELINQVPTLIC